MLRPKEADFEAEKKNSNKKLNFSNFACMCYGIFPTRNALKITFVFFQLQSIQHIVGAK